MMTALLAEVLTTDAMIKVAREQVVAFNQGDWERMQAGFAAEARYEELGTQRTVDGPDKIVELFKGWKQAFPDAAGTVTSAIASGDKVALELTWTGTQTGPLVTAEGTIPASGKHQKTPAAFFLTFAGHKVKESHHYFDALTLLKQIDAQPK
jgi:steroid delta-isomerase-like uncharacterized protein